jgi:hypothetical protein
MITFILRNITIFLIDVKKNSDTNGVVYFEKGYINYTYIFGKAIWHTTTVYNSLRYVLLGQNRYLTYFVND